MVLLQLINGLTIQKSSPSLGQCPSTSSSSVYTVLALGSPCLSDAANASNPHKKKARVSCAFFFGC